jgi:hypothetical protein
MKSTPDAAPSSSLVRALAGIAITLVIGAVLLGALAGWLTHGTAILFTYAQDGLAWCF